MNRIETSNLIKHLSQTVGFSYCGISASGLLEEEARQLEKWLSNNYHGEMTYMENHFDKRIDTTKLVEGSKSVISLLYNYFPENELNKEKDNFKIAKYAYGTDYHFVVKDKLNQLVKGIEEKVGKFDYRIFVDSAPVMDKAWAKKSGLGWIGKNTNLINKKMGSFFFIAEVICDLKLAYDSPIKDYCGTCTACLDACPTDALVAPYQIDGSKCISYFTIELKKEIPTEMRGKFENWIFGCDICQDVCPWNRFSTSTKEEKFKPLTQLIGFSKNDWIELTEESFKVLFKNSPIKRSKYEGLKRNIQFVK